MYPHFRPQVNGNTLQTTWYIPRIETKAPATVQPVAMQTFHGPIIFHSTPSMTCPRPQEIVNCFNGPACSPLAACNCHLLHHAPTFSTGQTHAPIQAVNGGYNHVSPSGPSQPLNATYPGSQFIAGPYMGPTKTELNYSMTTAIANEKPEEMVPAGTDPDRFYQVQELDGSWTRRNKRTIDGYLGPVKWNQRPDGTWFVIRLRDD